MANKSLIASHKSIYGWDQGLGRTEKGKVIQPNGNCQLEVMRELKTHPVNTAFSKLFEVTLIFF